MKKLLLSFLIIPSVVLLHGMEILKQDDSILDYSKLPPITLPQIYYCFADALSSDVAKHIFSLQPGFREINQNMYGRVHVTCFSAQATVFKNLIKDEMLKSYGYCYGIEWLNRYLLREGISICDIKDSNGMTVLHHSLDDTKIMKFFLQIAGKDLWRLLDMKNSEGLTALHYSVLWDNDSEILKLILNAVGDNAWTLLAMQDCNNCTALTYAAFNDNIESVKLLLDAAGDHAQELMAICEKRGRVAFEVATPDVKIFMQQYFQKKT